MNDSDRNNLIGARTDPEALLERYGGHLDELDLSDARKQEFFTTVWQIMAAFVDLGFSLKAGDKLTPYCDQGIDDVLQYLHLKETAPETVAPQNPNKNTEAR